MLSSPWFAALAALFRDLPAQHLTQHNCSLECPALSRDLCPYPGQLHSQHLDNLSDQAAPVIPLAWYIDAAGDGRPVFCQSIMQFHLIPMGATFQANQLPVAAKIPVRA